MTCGDPVESVVNQRQQQALETKHLWELSGKTSSRKELSLLTQTDLSKLCQIRATEELQPPDGASICRKGDQGGQEICCPVLHPWNIH